MSLIAHYKLDGNALDSSGNNNHGVVYGGLTYTDGKINKAGNFNGSSQYISAPYISTYLHNRPEASISLWCKKKSVQYGFIQLSGYADGNGNLYPYDTPTKVYLDIFRTNRLGPIEMNSTTLDWHFITIIQEPGVWKLYQNGELIYQTTANQTISTNYLQFEIGRNSNNRYANALIDDVRIYDHALSEKEVKELSKAKILHYDFDDFQEPTENILIGGEVPITSSNYDIKDYYFSTPMIDGETYTVSLNGQLGVGKTYFGLYNSGGSVRPVSLYPSDQDVNGTYTKTFTWTVGSSSNTYLRVYHMLSSTVVDSTINWIQLEQKDHATPFTSSTRTGSVSDKSGYDNHAELELGTTPQWTEDSKIGSGAYKNNNSTSIFIDTPYGNGINVADVPHTFSMWVYPVDGNSNQMFFSTSNGTNQRIYFAIRSGKWDMGIQGTAWGSGPTPTTINEWSHIVVVMDGSYAKMYVNGVYSFQKPYTSFTAASNFKILSRSDYPFNGSMDDVRIYATALSADDIKELYQTRASIDNKGNLFCGGIIINSINRCPSFLDWNLSNGAYIEGETLILPNRGSAAISPFVYIGDKNWTFSADYYSNDIIPNKTEGGYLQGSSYFDINKNSTINTSNYSGNGNAGTYPIKEWTRKVWAGPGGNEVRYLKINISNDSTYTAEEYKIVKPMITINGHWNIFYPYAEDFPEVISFDKKINEKGIGIFNDINEVGLPIRYIRDSMVGSSANTGNHWVEIQAFNSSDNNIALNKTAVSSILTDGSTNSSPYYSGGPATVDLGDIYTIMYLKIWHYWADARTYYKIKTEVSADNINWITVFDSDKDGEYVETSEGKEIILYPNKASIRETGEVFVREINEV